MLRWTLRCYELAASLSLAVILIFSSAVSLGLATFIEAAYGTPVVQFYVYQTWWFELLLILLAVNIFCAAAIRYPWKRHQTGFVITHIGLLTLLLGAFIGRSKGIDAQVSVFEGQMDKWAIDNAVNLQLNINQPGEKNSAIERVEFNFQPGLYNWSDWSKQFAWEQPGDENIATSNYFQWKLFRS
ncbi:MAG TPA: hypothetical protein VL096_06130, partial [Pirellulaceae bacterium]|nr:hypothetical protein [Pirellulaceae bacterium]